MSAVTLDPDQREIVEDAIRETVLLDEKRIRDSDRDAGDLVCHIGDSPGVALCGASIAPDEPWCCTPPDDPPCGRPRCRSCAEKARR